MTWILRAVWMFIAQRIQSLLVKKAKAMGLIAYLKLLQGTRRFMIASIVIFMLLQLTVLAGLGALVTAFILWDYDFQTKMELLLGIFSILCLCPLALIVWALSESTWYKASGAKKMVEDLRANS